MGNFFTSPPLLRLPREMGIEPTGIVLINRVEKTPLKSVKETENLERASSDDVNESNYNITFDRWKDNKLVAVASTLYGQSPMNKAQKYIKESIIE